jgi:NDP-sugar pyrophosphorylase family protein
MHRRRGAAATITVVPLRSPFGVVDLDADLVTGFREAPRLEHWVSCGVYVLGEEAIERMPERGDHETTTFLELAAEGRLQSPAARGNLVDGEHPQGPARRRRLPRGEPRLAGRLAWVAPGW